jgi:hypothetical protein
MNWRASPCLPMGRQGLQPTPERQLSLARCVNHVPGLSCKGCRRS